MEECDHSQTVEANGFLVCVQCGECIDIVLADEFGLHNDNDAKNQYAIMGHTYTYRTKRYDKASYNMRRQNKLNRQANGTYERYMQDIMQDVSVACSGMDTPHQTRETIKYIIHKIYKKGFRNIPVRVLIGISMILAYEKHDLFIDKDKLLTVLGLTHDEFYLHIDKLNRG